MDIERMKKRNKKGKEIRKEKKEIEKLWQREHNKGQKRNERAGE